MVQALAVEEGSGVESVEYFRKSFADGAETVHTQALLIAQAGVSLVVVVGLVAVVGLAVVGVLASASAYQGEKKDVSSAVASS